MSVAFRRDSDEEHLEPRFELPIPPGPNLVTEQGYAQIAARVAELDAQLAVELGEDVRKAVLRDVRYWRSRLTSAQLAPVPSGDVVAIGTRVSFERDGRARSVAIVGHDEGDPARGLLSFASPIARAMLGAAVGDECDLPGSDQPLTITGIAVA